jgi:hypothetical protein
MFFCAKIIGGHVDQKSNMDTIFLNANLALTLDLVLNQTQHLHSHGRLIRMFLNSLLNHTTDVIFVTYSKVRFALIIESINHTQADFIPWLMCMSFA